MVKVTWHDARTFAAIVAMAWLVGGCATTTTGGSRGGAFCDIAQPRRPSKGQIAVMTDEAKRQDLAFNRYGAEHCGWRP